MLVCNWRKESGERIAVYYAASPPWDSIQGGEKRGEVFWLRLVGEDCESRGRRIGRDGALNVLDDGFYACVAREAITQIALSPWDQSPFQSAFLNSRVSE